MPAITCPRPIERWIRGAPGQLARPCDDSISTKNYSMTSGAPRHHSDVARRRASGSCSVQSVRMQVAQAKQVARAWVLDEGSRQPGFIGAYFAGSVNWLPGDAELAATSDLDVNLVFGPDTAPTDRHKL